MTRLDGAALVTGGSERVREADVLAVRRLLEGGLEALLVDLLRSRVGDQVELRVTRAARGDADCRSEGDRGDPQARGEATRPALLICLSHGGFVTFLHWIR